MHATEHQGRLCPDLTRPNDETDLQLWFRVSAESSYQLTDAGLSALTATTPGTTDVIPATVLRNAATYLERYGWIQGAYYDPTSQVFTPAACMVGAIAMVCYGGPVEAPAQHFDDPGYLDFEEAVLHLDRWLLVEDGSEAYEFNDAKGRTIDGVTQALRRAAATPADELLDALRVITTHLTEWADSGLGDVE